MNKALAELKIRAKKLLKAYQQEPTSVVELAKAMQKRDSAVNPALKLKDCQSFLARKCGFRGWHEAKINLSGESAEDFSAFWHVPSCDALVNQWFARYEEAKLLLSDRPNTFLVPYKQQFIIVRNEYLHLIGLSDKDIVKLSAMGRDLVALYGSADWDELAKVVLIGKSSL